VTAPPKSRAAGLAPAAAFPGVIISARQESDGTSATDPSPKVTTFTYAPTGPLATELKPNNNLVTDAYYANDQLYTQTEQAGNGTGATVSSHTYTYDANGNQTADIQQLMSAASGGGTLSHTYNYTYNPLDAVTGSAGTATATYGYTAYGANNTAMFTGADKTTTAPDPAKTPTTPTGSTRCDGTPAAASTTWDSAPTTPA
jgi:hypothetical protein